MSVCVWRFPGNLQGRVQGDSSRLEMMILHDSDLRCVEAKKRNRAAKKAPSLPHGSGKEKSLGSLIGGPDRQRGLGISNLLSDDHWQENIIESTGVHSNWGGNKPCTIGDGQNSNRGEVWTPAQRCFEGEK